MLSISQVENPDYMKYSIILQEIIQSANQNIDMPGSAHRYSEKLKYFSIYLYMLCGKLCYETLYLNFSIPAPSSIGISINFCY